MGAGGMVPTFPFMNPWNMGAMGQMGAMNPLMMSQYMLPMGVSGWPTQSTQAGHGGTPPLATLPAGMVAPMSGVFPTPMGIPAASSAPSPTLPVATTQAAPTLPAFATPSGVTTGAVVQSGQSGTPVPPLTAQGFDCGINLLWSAAQDSEGAVPQAAAVGDPGQRRVSPTPGALKRG